MVGTWGLPGLSLAAVEQPEEELGARSASSSGSRWPLAEGYVWVGKGESDFPSLFASARALLEHRFKEEEKEMIGTEAAEP